MAKKVPITRLGKFFSEEDFFLEVALGQEWLNGDMNFTLVLYRVNRIKTKKDDVYGETQKDGIQFETPIEFKALVQVQAPITKNLGSSKIEQTEPGNIKISVYIKHLQDLNIDIAFGDYIGYYETETRVRYYTVIDDGRVVSDNKHNYAGYRPFYRTILAAPVNENEFRGI